MDNQDILAQISSTLSKQKTIALARLASDKAISIEGLIELSFHPDKKIAFRAAWVLENVLEDCPERFYPYIERFVEVFPNQENDSCRRHYTNILRSRAVKLHLMKLHDNVLEKLVESVFQWLIDEKAPVAVKANCLDILFDFSKRFDWIKEELQAQIHFLLKDGGPAIQARGRKILGKLGCEQ